MRWTQAISGSGCKLALLLMIAGCALEAGRPGATAREFDDPICPTNLAGFTICPVCGDGVCDAGEDVSCPGDCPQPPDDPPPTGIQWSAWLDRDDPSGDGDWETRVDFPAGQVGCASPVAIEARTVSGVPAQSTGEVLQISPSVGLICHNSSQPDGACQDYQVRFGCGALDLTPLFQSWHANNSLFSGDIEYFVPSSVPVPAGRFVGQLGFDASGGFSELQLAPNDAHYTDFGGYSVNGATITATFSDRFRGNVVEHLEIVELSASVLRFRRL